MCGYTNTIIHVDVITVVLEDEECGYNTEIVSTNTGIHEGVVSLILIGWVWLPVIRR